MLRSNGNIETFRLHRSDADRKNAVGPEEEQHHEQQQQQVAVEAVAAIWRKNPELRKMCVAAEAARSSAAVSQPVESIDLTDFCSWSNTRLSTHAGVKEEEDFQSQRPPST